jgi:signal transduction histidine kinase/ligand-binding sensor domain-containing protein
MHIGMGFFVREASVETRSSSLTLRPILGILANKSFPASHWSGIQRMIPRFRGLRLFIACAILASFPLGSTRADAHELRFQHLDTQIGLSQNSALCILQDSRGFLWVGTQSGLNRFDGYSFVSYHHDPLDSSTISENYVVGIAEDHRHRLWVTQIRGQIDVFLPATGMFERLRVDALQWIPPMVPRGAVFLSDRIGGLWLGFRSGMLLYLPPDSLSYAPQTALDEATTRAVTVPNGIEALLEDSRGNFWAAGTGGITLLTRSSDDPPTVARSWKTPSMVHSLAELSTMPGYLWVGTADGLLLFDAKSGVFVPWEPLVARSAMLRTSTIFSIAEVTAGILWIGTTRHGLFELNMTQRSVRHFAHDPAIPSGMRDDWINTIYRDRSGVIWLGTLTGGLAKSLGDAYPFRIVGYDPNDRLGLRDNDVTAILEDRNRTLWVGTRKGSLHRSHESASVLPFRFHQYQVDHTARGRLADSYVKAIHEDRRGALWIGVWAFQGGGLYRADQQREFFTRFAHNPKNPSTLPSNLIRSIRDDEDGHLWVGMTGGFSRSHLDSIDELGFQTYPVKMNDSYSLSQDDVFSIALSNRARGREVWIASFSGGLNRLHPSTGRFEQFHFDPRQPRQLCSDRVTTVYEDRTGNIWIGTLAGLTLLRAENRAMGVFECFNEWGGLLHNDVQSILEDDHGNLWLSTQNGIARFDPNARTFTNFHNGTHLPIREFNVNSACRGADGRLYFGGTGGFVYFYPDSVRINTHPPEVVITSLKVFEKELRLDSAITHKREVTLSYDQHFLSFEFAALDFREPERNQYAYMLDGVHSGWIHIGNRRYVSLSNIEPGEYVFRVKASNNDGVWNESGAALRIVVVPPFWKTMVFQFTVGGVLLVGLIAGVRYASTIRLRRRLKELEVLQKIQDERERISRELHDDIGSNLTNIATGLEVSRKFAASDSQTDLTENLTFLEGAARSTMRSLRETIWSLQPQSASVASLIQRIEDYIDERSRLITTPAIQCTSSGSIHQRLTPSQALNVFRICQEAISNALKHAVAMSVMVTVETKEECLLVRITDDGRGFTVASVESVDGYGLTNMKRRAERIGAEFTIRSEPSCGTTVSVMLPLMEIRPDAHPLIR